MARPPIHPKEEVFAFLFPANGVDLCGFRPNSRRDTANTLLATQSGWDGNAMNSRTPVGDGVRPRFLALRFNVNIDTARELTVEFQSGDRMEVDGPFRMIKNHLDSKLHPNKRERKGHNLNYMWSTPSGTIEVTRYMEMEHQLNVLRVIYR